MTSPERSEPAVSHWRRWHVDYDDPGSSLARRLVVVQDAIRSALPVPVTGAWRAASVCAGDGRDLIEVLASWPGGQHAQALLVERDPDLAGSARQAAGDHGLAAVEVVAGDAALLATFDRIAPVDLLLICGVLGNISEDDAMHTITCLPQLCRPGAVLIWTRGRRDGDQTPMIRAALRERDFNELDFVAPSDAIFSVGVARYVGPLQELDRNQSMFTFGK